MSEGRVEGRESSNSRSPVSKRTERQTSKTHASAFRPQKKEKWCTYNGTASGQEKACHGHDEVEKSSDCTKDKPVDVVCCFFFWGYFICLEREWFLIHSLNVRSGFFETRIRFGPEARLSSVSYFRCVAREKEWLFAAAVARRRRGRGVLRGCCCFCVRPKVKNNNGKPNTNIKYNFFSLSFCGALCRCCLCSTFCTANINIHYLHMLGRSIFSVVVVVGGSGRILNSATHNCPSMGVGVWRVVGGEPQWNQTLQKKYYIWESIVNNSYSVKCVQKKMLRLSCLNCMCHV